MSEETRQGEISSGGFDRARCLPYDFVGRPEFVAWDVCRSPALRVRQSR